MLRLLVVAVLTSSLAAAQAGGFDSTFGDDGVVVLDGTLASGEVRLAAMPDGGVAFAFCQPGAAEHAATVVRLTENGAPDPGFGTNGVVEIGVGDGSCPRGVAAAPDGGVLVLGNGAFTLLKLDIDGVLDLSFGTEGRLDLDVLPVAFATSASGEIVVSGVLKTDRSQSRLFRLTPDGALDPSFGNGGIRLNPPNGAGLDLAIGPDGQVATIHQVIQEGLNETSDFQVGQVLANGSNASGFGRDGLAYNTLRSIDRFHDLTFEPDGGIIVAGLTGTTEVGIYVRFGVARLTPMGAVDREFGTNGLLEILAPEDSYDVEVMPDGRIVALAASNRGEFAIARILPNGTLDTAFGDDGIAVQPDGLSLTAQSVAVQRDERVVVAGTGSWRGASGVTIARVLGDRAVPTEPEPEAGEVAVSVWPNPSATGHLQVRVFASAISPVQVDALDALGRVVASESRTGVGSETRISLDLSSLGSGLYLIRAVTASGTSTVPITIAR